LVASDAVGIITVAPLAISLVKALREPPPRNETLEGVVALVVLAVMTAIIVSLPPEPWEPVAPVPLLFPILLWTTSRCQPVFAAVAAFIVSLTIMWTTTFGIIGHFGHPVLPIGDRILRSGGHPECRALRICSSALFAERRRHEALLQEALAAGALMAFECNPLSGLAQRSENAAQILELGPQQTLTVAQFLARIHPDDLVRFKAHNNRASVDPPGGRFRQCPQHRPSRHNRNHVQGRMPLRGG
jgi:MASE1 protein